MPAKVQTIFGSWNIVVDQVRTIMANSRFETSVEGTIWGSGVAIGADSRIEVVAISVEKATGSAAIRSKPREELALEIFLTFILTFFD